MSFLRPIALAIVALCMTTGVANGNIVETFSYPDGALVPNGGWTTQSGTPGTLLVSGGQAIVSQDSGSEDTELQFANDLTSGMITAVFDISVSANEMTGTDFEYFAHFSNNDDFNFRSRVDVVGPNGTSGYTLGLSTGGGTAEVMLPVDFAFGDTVNVELSFDLDTGESFLTAGGSTVMGTSTSLGETLDSFNLRQSNSSSDEIISVDNLSITFNKIPEPTTAAILGLGLVAGMARRRR